MVPERDPASAPVASWREVTVDQFRRYNLISTVAGVLILAWGLWELTHFKLVWGLTLVVVGFIVGLWTAALRIDGTPALLATQGHMVDANDERWVPRVVHFYTRQNCSLCQEALARLRHDLDGSGVQVVDHDVDRDPILQRRYGERVPVAVFDGGELFALRYDERAVRAIVAPEAAGRSDAART